MEQKEVAKKCNSTPATCDKDYVINLATQFYVSRALHVATSLGIADALIDGPLHVNELADKLVVDTESLYSLLRVLVGQKIFDEVSPRTFALNDKAQFLTPSHPDMLRDFIQYHCGESICWRAMEAMEHTIETGAPAFNHVFGKGYFDYIADRATTNDNFNVGMANLSAKEDKLLAEKLDLEKYKTVVDVGGGNGGLLYRILNHYDHLKGVLFELKAVLDSLDKKQFAPHQERVQYVMGSFFERIVEGADCYLLKRVLHDWNDQQCITILKNCAKVLREGSTLIVFEGIVPDEKGPHWLKNADLFMRVMFGGKERTQTEYELLFRKAGLTLQKVEGPFAGMNAMWVTLA